MAGRRAFPVLSLVAAAGLAAGLAVAARRGRPEPLPELGTLPAFALLDQERRTLTREGLAGRPFVADFIFTRCAGICPAMTARMAQLDKTLPEGIGLVSFTVDPEHDTPEVLARYAHGFGAGPRWRFAAGSRAALHGLATEGFRLAAMEVPEDQRQGGDGPFLHSAKFVLVDAAARIRGYYDSEDRADLGRLAADARRLLEAPP